MRKIIYYCASVFFAVVWLIFFGSILRSAVEYNLRAHWKNLLISEGVETIDNLKEFLKRKTELLKIGVGENRSKTEVKPIVKAAGRTAHKFFSTEFYYGSYYLRFWYTSEFLFKKLDDMKGLISAIIALGVASGIIGFALFIHLTVFGPIAQIESGKMGGKDPFGLFAEMRRKFLSNLNDAKSSDMHMSVLFKAAKSISSHFDLNQTIGRILDIVTERFPETSCTVTFLDDDGFLKIRNSRGLSAEFVRNMKLKRGEGFAGECIDSKKVIVLQDVERDFRGANKEILKNENIRSFAHMPIIVENKAIGTFNVNASRPDYFTQNVVEVITTLSEYLSIAVTNSRLYDKVKDFNRRLEIEVSYTMSELLKTNNKLVGKIRECRALADVLGIIRSEQDAPKAVERIFDRLKEVVLADFYTFLSYNDETDSWTRYLQVYGYQKMGWDENYKLPADPAKQPLISDVIAARKPYMNNETIPELNWKFIPSEVYFKNIIILPTYDDHSVNGVIVVANKVGDKFDNVDLDFLSMVASCLSLYIEKQKLLLKIVRYNIKEENLKIKPPSRRGNTEET